MAYSDKTYFLTKIKLSELNNLIEDDAGVPQDSYLTEAIKSADGEIDSYLKSVVTTLPLNPVPDIIKQRSFDIAMFYLHKRIDIADRPESVLKDYEKAIQWLDKVAKKLVNLPVADTSTEDHIQYNSDGADIDRGSY